MWWVEPFLQRTSNLVMNRIALPEDVFFDTANSLHGWVEMRATCLVRKWGISVTMSKDSVVLQPAISPTGAAAVVLHGDWRVAGFEALPAAPATARLFVPFLFDITGLTVPYDLLAGSDDMPRPVADVFAAAILQGMQAEAPLTVRPGGVERRGRHIRKFRRQYYRLFRTRFPDPAFEGLNALEMGDILLANGFAPALDFADPVLEDGARHLRRLTA